MPNARVAHATGSNWALGIEARSRALLREGATAEGSYRKAMEHLSRTRVRAELARTHLLFGEWLRRANRRVDARGELAVAYELFSTMGMQSFAERTRRELLATGATVHKRTVETRDDLTAQEAQIARLARDGLSNPESAGNSSSAPEPSNGIFARCSTSLASAPAGSCGASSPTVAGPSRAPSGSHPLIDPALTAVSPPGDRPGTSTDATR